MKSFDLAASNRALRPALDAAYGRVMDSGWAILGPEVDAFEAEFAAFCGAKACVGVGNGLDALTLALKAAGIGRGQEVIVPSHTFIATWLAVSMTGARPVPAEVDPALFTIDPAAVEAAITPRTAAIIVVSLYGQACDMDTLSQIAGRRGLFLLEDAAQAHGGRYKGRRVGSLAHATAFSFYPTKNLGALGDGGGVVTDDEGLAGRLRSLRNYGSQQKYVHAEIGLNSRLDEVQAAFLRAKLPLLDEWNERRRQIAAAYQAGLANLEGLTTPSTANFAQHVYHQYVVKLDRRDAVAADLARQGVQTLVHYPIPCHLQAAYADLGLAPGAFPVAERLASQVLSLPLWPQMTLADVERVCETLRRDLGPRR